MGGDYKKIRVGFYLRKWRMLEENRNILTLHEIDTAKLLFNSLPNLSERDLFLLRLKYYDSHNKSSFDKDRGVYRSCIPNNDEVVAYHLNMPIEQYRIERRIAEKHLEEEMLVAGEAMLMSKEKIYLKINRFLYIKSVDIHLDVLFHKQVEVGDVTLTGNHIIDEKKVFDLSDETIKQGVLQLERYGFQREALHTVELEELENGK